MRQHLPVVMLAVGLWAGWAAATEAQWPGPSGEPSEADLAEARQLYQRGTEAVEEQRWPEAVELFEGSYALSGASVALYSLGYTLRALGRHREARDTFDQLLRDHGDLEASIRSEAERLREEVAERVAVLSLAGLPEEGTPVILLDDQEVSDSGIRPLPVESDPGLHALRVEAAGFQPFSWRGELAPGERLRLDLDLEPRARSVTESPIFWLAIGAAALAVGVIGAVILHGNAQLEPRSAHHITL